MKEKEPCWPWVLATVSLTSFRCFLGFFGFGGPEWLNRRYCSGNCTHVQAWAWKHITISQTPATAHFVSDSCTCTMCDGVNGNLKGCHPSTCPLYNYSRIIPGLDASEIQETASSSVYSTLCRLSVVCQWETSVNCNINLLNMRLFLNTVAMPIQYNRLTKVTKVLK